MSQPRVTLKIASSLDGRIALANGESQWITSSDSRARGHMLRADHDAVLAGIGTVLADDPLLTARTVPAPPKQPTRIVMDSRARTPLHTRLMQSQAITPVVIACVEDASAQPLEDAGAQIWRCGQGAHTDPVCLLRHANANGLTSILIEGGGRVAASFLAHNLVDQIAWFRAPILIGGDGRAAIAGLGLGTLASASRWRPIATERIGDDVLDTYART
jgi:diaminohydroxyphosphoribosylaminopyrimidine deaminase / 5-amino-6-(5-phosphoribosylamino)uracil reductase